MSAEHAAHVRAAGAAALVAFRSGAFPFTADRERWAVDDVRRLPDLPNYSGPPCSFRPDPWSS